MPQRLLPLFPQGVTHITAELAVQKKDGEVTYFNVQMPVFIHEEDDLRTFRMITAQFCCNGNAKQADIARAFGVPLISVKRAVKRYREQGVAGFYAKRASRGATVLTVAVLEQVQELFDAGLETAEVARRLEIKVDTLRKAVGAGRVHKPEKKNAGFTGTG